MERAQQKVEARNFEIRKTLLKFDDVMNDQRKDNFWTENRGFKNRKRKKNDFSFLEEINKNIILAQQNFAKSINLKVFSNEIKANYGNAFDEKKLELFSKIKEVELKQNLDNFF